MKPKPALARSWPATTSATAGSIVAMKNSAGGHTVSVVNCQSMKRAVAIVGLVVAATFTTQTVRAGDFDPIFGFYRPELFASISAAELLRDLPMTEYLGGRLPGSTALGRMGTAPVGNFPIALVNAEPHQKTNNAVSGPVKDPKDGKDYSSVESMAVEKASLTWTGGEIGFMYGHASGKFGGDEFSSYIMGGVGSEHLQINVGAGYEETHFSHSHR